MEENEENYVMIEDRDVYDGWCCKFFPEDKSFEWRDHWAVDKLTQRKKNEIELSILENWTND